jgi:integrase
MGRSRYSEREYRVGDFWLGQRSGSPAWYRCWLEGRRTLRRSLGTDDFETAKALLNAWWAENFRQVQQELPPSKVQLSAVIADYWNHQGSKLRSAQTVKIMLRYWNEWWKDATVADVRNPNKQDDFRAHLAGKGLNPTSVSRCLEIGRAAIRRAWKRGVIASFPHVEVPLIRETKPKGRPLTVEEIGRLLGGTEERHMQLFIMLLLGTAARSEPILTLTWAQIDEGLIRLNPEGRQQTSKRRPVVRVPPTLATILDGLERHPSHPQVIIFRGRPIGKVDTGWHKMVRRAGLSGQVTPYSLRHSAARWMRSKGVPMEQVSGQLGHAMPGFSMTEIYAPSDPAYLRESTAALDQLLALVYPAASQLHASGDKKDVGLRPLAM